MLVLVPVFVVLVPRDIYIYMYIYAYKTSLKADSEDCGCFFELAVLPSIRLSIELTIEFTIGLQSK